MLSETAISEVPLSTARRLLMLGAAVPSARLEFSFRILAATDEFATEPTDPLPNIPFAGTLQRALRLDRSVISDTGFGKVSRSWGELELSNVDGAYDDIVNRYSIDGRRIVVKVGAKGRGYDTFKVIFDGTASGWIVTQDALRIQLRDNGYKLAVPASTNLYAGTGELTGGSDLAGKRKPLAFGSVSNITPVLLLPSELVYQVHDGAVHGIPAVYDRGSPLTFDADYA